MAGLNAAEQAIVDALLSERIGIEEANEILILIKECDEATKQKKSLLELIEEQARDAATE